jgi:hypothetical protein
MKKYHLLFLSTSGNFGDPGYVNVTSTDTAILNWIILALPKVKTQKYSSYTISLPVKADQADDLFWWITEKLGQQGWEPFAIETPNHFYFRKETEQE